MAIWRHRGGTLLGVLVAAVVFVACTSEPTSVVIEDTSDSAAAAGAGELTPFAERLYGSTWEVIQAQLNGEALVAHWRSPVELGGFSFFGTRKALSVSVNHPCGSTIAPVEISDDRIVTTGFNVPAGCEDVAAFALFAQPKIAAAFNGQRLELTGDNASLAAEHFLSTSDNGTAPLYRQGDPYVLYQPSHFKLSAHANAGNDTQTFVLVVGSPDRCSRHCGTLLDPVIRYERDHIRIAVPAVVGRLDVESIPEGLPLGYGPTELTVTLDEPRNGRPIVLEEPTARLATEAEIDAAIAVRTATDMAIYNR